MNYRHGYHAGNHTEPFKHAVLLALVELLKSKDKPFMVLDTHAGAGIYDLRSEMAARTLEAEGGIVPLMGSHEPALDGYLRAVRTVGGDGATAYPGSPELVRAALRPADRLVACELHAEDAATLKSNMAADPRVGVHHRDGYEAALALVPPRERRGLVFVDPPFEDPSEFERLASFLSSAVAKWPTGIVAAWYPVKHAGAAGLMRSAALASSAKEVLSATFLRFPLDGVVLAGSGMVILNPPWRTSESVIRICEALARGFGAGRWSVDVLRASG